LPNSERAKEKAMSMPKVWHWKTVEGTNQNELERSVLCRYGNPCHQQHSSKKCKWYGMSKKDTNALESSAEQTELDEVPLDSEEDCTMNLMLEDVRDKETNEDEIKQVTYVEGTQGDTENDV